MDSDSQLVLPCLLILTAALQGVGSEGNLALGKNATQKSTLCHTFKGESYCNSAWRAVDGMVHTNDPEEGCASTADSADTDAWWMVDLGRVYVITNMTVYNRRGSYFRLRDLWIRVSNRSDITQHISCTYKSKWIGQGASETFTCDSTLSGRWVSIQRTNDLAEDGVHGHGFLQLCEVQVYGYQYTGVTPDTRQRTTWGPEITQAKVRTTPPSVITRDGGNTAAPGITSDSRKSTSLTPERTQVKAARGWPLSAIITSVILGVVVLIQVVIITIVRKKYTRIRKEADERKETATVSMGSLAMTREREKKYETLNRGQMTSPVPQVYESLGQP